MKAGFVIGLVCAASALAVGSAASFAQAAGLSIEVSECVELASAEARYACFDQQVEAALKDDKAELEKNARGTPSAEGDPPNAVTERRDSRPEPQRLGFAEEPEESEQFGGKIAALDERLPNEYVITLDNGQVWQQVGSKRFGLRVGQHVSIVSSRWGNSYRLSAEELKGFIQVQRIP